MDEIRWFITVDPKPTVISSDNNRILKSADNTKFTTNCLLLPFPLRNTLERDGNVYEGLKGVYIFLKMKLNEFLAL